MMVVLARAWRACIWQRTTGTVRALPAASTAGTRVAYHAYLSPETRMTLFIESD